MMSSFIADLLTGLGLVLTGLGAWWAARSLILTEDDAVNIGVARFASEVREENLKLPHVQSLLASSRGARIGLWLIVAGTVLQIAPVAVRLF
jgi:hypothetical protein